MNHPTAAPRAGRRTRLAVTAGLTAALAIGAPAAAQAEEALPADLAAQTAQEQTVPPTAEAGEAANTTGIAETTGALEAAGADGTGNASGPAETDETAGAPGPAETGGAVDGGDGLKADAPVDASEPVGPSQPDGAVEPAEGAEPGDASAAPGEDAPAEGANPPADAVDGVTEAADGSTADLAESTDDAAAALAADGSEGADDPAGESDTDTGLDQSESGELTLLEGEGFSYAVLTGEEEPEEDEWGRFHVGDKSAYYYGPGAYVWVDEGVASFSVPAQLDGAPVVSVTCTDGNLESLDLSAAAPTLIYLDCAGNNLSEVDLTGCAALRDLSVSENPLAALDLSGCPNLRALFCNNVGLTVLDISNNPLIDLLDCRDAEVEEIVLCDPAPGAALVFFLDNNRLDDEELAKIAAWEEEVDAIVIFGDQRPPLTPEEPTDPEEPGKLELLRGEGFSYAVVTDEVELDNDGLKFYVGDKSSYYYGLGVYVWVDEGVTSFSVPAQLDGEPVAGVICAGGSLESLDLTAAAPTLLGLDCTGN